VIRSARLDPDWASVQRGTMGIAARAISTMIASSGYNDVVRMYNTTHADDVGYNLAYIGRDFTMALPEPFDPGFMRRCSTTATRRLAMATTGRRSRRAISPHISHCVGASGPRIGESSFARRTLAEAEEFRKADRV
jgi:hypothetical protein